MYNQYAPHQRLTPFKDYWNLDEWRPDVGCARTILTKCNPLECDENSTVGIYHAMHYAIRNALAVFVLYCSFVAWGCSFTNVK